MTHTDKHIARAIYKDCNIMRDNAYIAYKQYPDYDKTLCRIYEVYIKLSYMAMDIATALRKGNIMQAAVINYDMASLYNSIVAAITE